MMRSDEDLMADYEIDADDDMALADARFLEDAASLAGYEGITDVLDLNRIQEGINAAYSRAVSSDHRELVSLAEHAVVYHSRMKKFLGRLISAERQSWEPPAPSEHEAASDFVDRVSRGACSPPMIVEGLVRAYSTFLLAQASAENQEHAVLDAASEYMTDMLDWSRWLHHDVVELGYRGAVLKMFEFARDYPALWDRLNSLWMERKEPPLPNLLEERESLHQSGRSDVSDEWFW